MKGKLKKLGYISIKEGSRTHQRGIQFFGTVHSRFDIEGDPRFGQAVAHFGEKQHHTFGEMAFLERNTRQGC